MSAWRLSIAVFVASVIAGSTVFPGSAATDAAQGKVASVALPAGFSFSTVAPFEGQLLLSGIGTRVNECIWLLVDPTTLRLGQRVTSDCERPPAFMAESVVPVVFQRSVGNISGRGSFVRIARMNPVSRKVILGPVVMTFNDGSDSHPEWTYGGGSLWLYDQATPTGSVVLDVSVATGRVKSAVRVPKVIYRPLLAADTDGLWIANPPGSSEPSPLFHIARGERTVSAVHRAGIGVLWLVASRHAVWIDTLLSVTKSGFASQAVWRFDGPGAKGRFLARADRLNSGAAVADGASGLLTVNPVPAAPHKFTTCNYAQIVRIDQLTGKETLAANILTPGSNCALLSIGPTGLTYDHALFFLINGSGNRQLLYRVRSH